MQNITQVISNTTKKQHERADQNPKGSYHHPTTTNKLFNNATILDNSGRGSVGAVVGLGRRGRLGFGEIHEVLEQSILRRFHFLLEGEAVRGSHEAVGAALGLEELLPLIVPCWWGRDGAASAGLRSAKRHRGRRIYEIGVRRRRRRRRLWGRGGGGGGRVVLLWRFVGSAGLAVAISAEIIDKARLRRYGSL